MSAKHDRSRIDNCVLEYIKGRSVNNIAADTGVSISVICRELKARGIEARGNRRELSIDSVCQRYAAGESEKALADAFGVARSAIGRCLVRGGVERRTASQAEALKWSAITDPQARRRQVAAANEAARGRIVAIESKIKHALTVMARRLQASPIEDRLAAMLAGRGIGVVAQEAVGPYNCDLGAFPVAVEVFGGSWHWHGRHMARTPDRIRHFLNRGWHVLMVKVDGRNQLTEATADYVAAYVQQARRNPAAPREYRVIRGAGETVAAGRGDDDDITIKPTLGRGRNTSGQHATVPR